MPYEVTYYLNLNLRGKSFDGFGPDDMLVFVGTVDLPARFDQFPYSYPAASVEEVLDQAFYAFNRVDAPVPVLDNAQAPSMSVGDVVRVVVGPSYRWFVVERVGFKEIEAPVNFVTGTQPIPTLLDDYYSQSEGT